MGAMIMTSAGDLGNKLIEFPANYIQPSRDEKHTIQSGYLDLLYFEYRKSRVNWMAQIGSVCLVFSVLTWIVKDYLSVVLAVIASIGTVILFLYYKEAKRFTRYWRNVKEELQSLGVGISHAQLNTSTIDSTGWGRLAGYTISNLGIVRPVTTKGFIETEPHQRYLFDLFDDQIYRS